MTSSWPALAFDRVQHTMTVGRRSVQVASGPDDNEAILRAFLKLVAEQRGVPVGQGLVLRRRDIAVLADFLDLDDEALESKLATILRLSEREAVDLRAQLRRHRVTAAAVGVGMLAGVPAAPAAADTPTASAAAPAGALAEEAFARSASVETRITIDALERMDTIVSASAPVVVPSAEWSSRKRQKVPKAATAPAPALQPATEPAPEIGHAVTYEQDPDLQLPPGVEIGSALVLER